MGLPDYSQNPYSYGTQKYRLLERLRKGPINNSEIVRYYNILNYTGRISEMRQAGFNILASTIKRGLVMYQLVP
jgi:hypothetical protein